MAHSTASLVRLNKNDSGTCRAARPRPIIAEKPRQIPMAPIGLRSTQHLLALLRKRLICLGDAKPGTSEPLIDDQRALSDQRGPTADHTNALSTQHLQTFT